MTFLFSIILILTRNTYVIKIRTLLLFIDFCVMSYGNFRWSVIIHSHMWFFMCLAQTKKWLNFFIYRQEYTILWTVIVLFNRSRPSVEPEIARRFLWIRSESLLMCSYNRILLLKGYTISCCRFDDIYAIITPVVKLYFSYRNEVIFFGSKEAPELSKIELTNNYFWPTEILEKWCVILLPLQTILFRKMESSNHFSLLNCWVKYN